MMIEPNACMWLLALWRRANSGQHVDMLCEVVPELLHITAIRPKP